MFWLIEPYFRLKKGLLFFGQNFEIPDIVTACFSSSAPYQSTSRFWSWLCLFYQYIRIRSTFRIFGNNLLQLLAKGIFFEQILISKKFFLLSKSLLLVQSNSNSELGHFFVFLETKNLLYKIRQIKFFRTLFAIFLKAAQSRKIWETSRNKLKKHSVTKNCSALSLFE